MADPHYYAGGQEASAPQMPVQYDPPQQLQQQQSYQEPQLLQQQQSYQEPQQLQQQQSYQEPLQLQQQQSYQEPQQLQQQQSYQEPQQQTIFDQQQQQPQTALSNYQTNGPQQVYQPDYQVGAPVEQQIVQQYHEDPQFVSNSQPPTQGQPFSQQVSQQDLPVSYQQPLPHGQPVSYRPPPQGPPASYQAPLQGLPQEIPQQYQQNLQEYQQDNRGQYGPYPAGTRHQSHEPNYQEYYDDYPGELLPIRDRYDPPPPPQEHMRYELYPEPESDIRYEGHSSRYQRDLVETRHPRQSNRGHRSAFLESQMDRSYLRAADRFPLKEHQARYDSGVDSRKKAVIRSTSFPRNELHRDERYRPPNGREEFRTRPLRYAYTSPERNRPRENFSNEVPRFEAYRSPEPPTRNKFASPERDRFRFDEMARALPRPQKINRQSKSPEKAGYRHMSSSNERDIAPDYGYKWSGKRNDFPKESRRRAFSPPPPPPKPRISQRQSMKEPLSPRENFPSSRRSRDRYL